MYIHEIIRRNKQYNKNNILTTGSRPRALPLAKSVAPASALPEFAISDGISCIPTAAASSGGRSGS